MCSLQTPRGEAVLYPPAIVSSYWNFIMDKWLRSLLFLASGAHGQPLYVSVSCTDMMLIRKTFQRKNISKEIKEHTHQESPHQSPSPDRSCVLSASLPFSPTFLSVNCSWMPRGTQILTPPEVTLCLSKRLSEALQWTERDSLCCDSLEQTHHISHSLLLPISRHFL